MPRTLSVPSTLYPAGEYGPYEINNFGSANTDWVELSLSVEDWPEAAPLITGSLLWSTGDGARFSINSPLRNRDGTMQTHARIRVGVPRRANGKAAISTATLNLATTAPLRTAVSLVAGRD